jgi:hypothetical protein
MTRWLRFAMRNPRNDTTRLMYEGSKNSMAGIGLATSEVTVSGFQVLSTTWKGGCPVTVEG